MKDGQIEEITRKLLELNKKIKINKRNLLAAYLYIIITVVSTTIALVGIINNQLSFIIILLVELIANNHFHNEYNEGVFKHIKSLKDDIYLDEKMIENKIDELYELFVEEIYKKENTLDSDVNNLEHDKEHDLEVNYLDEYDKEISHELKRVRKKDSK